MTQPLVHEMKARCCGHTLEHHYVGSSIHGFKCAECGRQEHSIRGIDWQAEWERISGAVNDTLESLNLAYDELRSIQRIIREEGEAGNGKAYKMAWADVRHHEMKLRGALTQVRSLCTYWRHAA